MRYLFIIILGICITIATNAQNADSIFIRKIYSEALTNAQCYDNLKYLCKNIGPRLTGSANAEKAVNYTYDLISALEFSNVFKQSVIVPHWVRGEKEKASVSYVDEVELENSKQYLDKETITKRHNKTSNLHRQL